MHFMITKLKKQDGNVISIHTQFRSNKIMVMLA